MCKDRVTNVVIAGLGGQGVIKASAVLADAAFRAGFDVKTSEIHGMSQRGGLVASDVRFGDRVLSPMVPDGEADFLVVLAEGELEAARRYLRPGGLLIAPDCVDAPSLPNRKSLNIALMGVLSQHLAIAEQHWLEAIRSRFPEALSEPNVRAFLIGRGAAAGQPGDLRTR